MALRIYSETLPYDQVTSARALGLLATYGLELVLAVRPWQLGELPRVAGSLRDAGISLSVWPMLADDDGRWANARSAAAFVDLARQTVDVLVAAGARPRELLLDLEPSLDESRMLLPRAARGTLGRRRRERGAFVEAERVLARAVEAIHARGVATASAVWPLVALDPPGARGWQSLLGTPVDALPTARVSAMVYTSILEGWSRGALRRRDAAALLSAASTKVVRRFGERASISLGCVGTGAFDVEPTYRSAAELAEDVALARAAGCEDLSLFDLAGVLARAPAEAWLDALTGAHDPPVVPPSRRVDAARALARAATWGLKRLL